MGLLGSKQARVLVTKKLPVEEVKLEAALKFTKELLESMGFSSEVTGVVEDECIKLDVTGENLGLLIGRRGETLDSLQYLIGLAVNRQGGNGCASCWMWENIGLSALKQFGTLPVNRLKRLV